MTVAIKQVMRRGPDELLVRVASFRMEDGRLIATYDDANYERELERDGIAVVIGSEPAVLRPADGARFFDALDHAFTDQPGMAVTVHRDDPPPSDGNIGRHRCPRCAYQGVMGRRHTRGERTIEERFCPNCNLNEVADSDQPTYASVLERWHPHIQQSTATPRILAVGMLDVATFGMDAFFVQISDTEVMHYEVHRDGRIDPVPDTALPLDQVYSSVEKFNHGYLVEEPVVIDSISALPGFLGRFEITSDTRCRYLGPA